MIPQRIKLRGFLCYKDEQAIDFQGSATLWMLSGLNGSGKSAIFDAVTFALFGHHRGGASGNVELINKDSDTLVVEFDFLLDGHLCRVKRTLKRDTKGGARGTQQMFLHEDAKWVPIAETAQKREFDKWVAENIGLNYDTFTSSVLLLQGKAEKLLDSRPEGRREVLASIVDLERYERLHQKADERRKTIETTVKALNGRLAALPAVEPLELAAARSRISEAEEARTAARAEVERLQALEYQSRLWQDLQARLVQARSRHTRAQALLAGSAQIEQLMDRLRELREVTPRLQDIVVLRGQAHQAAQQHETLSLKREQKLLVRAERESAVKQAEERRRTLQAQADSQGRQYRELSIRFREASVQLGKLSEAERQEQELERVHQDRAALPANPAEQAKQARETMERLEALARVVPVLDRFRGRRDELAQAVADERQADEGMQNVRKRGEELKRTAEELKQNLEQTTATHRDAAEQATEARTLFQQARSALEEVSNLDGAHVCRHCGQALTAGHVEEEKVRRGKAATEAEARAKATAQALERAKKAEQELRGRYEKADRDCQEAREEWQAHNVHLKQAKAAIDRLQRECAAVYDELPEEHAKRVAKGPVADWQKTAYPAAADVEAVRAEARGVDAARRKLRDAEAVVQKHATLTAQEKSIRSTLERLLGDLPKDRAAVRKTHADLEHQEKALFQAIDAGRARAQETEKECQRLVKERDEVQAEIGKIDADLRERQLVQDNAQRGIGQAMRQLPDAWKKSAETIGMAQLNVLTKERDDLIAQQVDEQSRELEHARANLQVLRQDVEALEKQEVNYPPEARQRPDQIGAALREAKVVDARSDSELSSAQQQLMLLESYEKQRQEVRNELKAQEGELHTYRTLAELLGRERLQLYLVRQAERQVVEYANAVLDRLSGGQLYLKLSGEASGEQGTAKALELEAFNRATGDRPINVAFLSGSQKFRVAVSLALGIGQYASRQHRPIESVIIDEGFGCLDSQGRQVMIQELQNLRSQMRCILLVSHQEDFAEAFSDGYQFRLENGATRVTRFQK